MFFYLTLSTFNFSTSHVHPKALQKVAFAEIFIFASFGNVRFSKIRVGTSCSSFFRTRPDSRELIPTPIFANNREKIAKKHEKRVGTSLLTKFLKVTKK